MRQSAYIPSAHPLFPQTKPARVHRFPATGTPDCVAPATATPVKIEHSDQVTVASHMVPDTGDCGGIRPEQTDWLDKDAAIQS